MNSIWGAVIVPVVWLIDVGWIAEGETSWTLNAQNQGEYSIAAELLTPLTQGHLSMTWGQTLNGSVEIVVYATSGIAVQAENLDSEESLFTWQATGVAKGNYILSAKAISNSGKTLRAGKIIVVTD